MKAACQSCGYDPGFDAFVCPKCRAPMRGGHASGDTPRPPVDAFAPTMADVRGGGGAGRQSPDDRTVFDGQATVASRVEAGGCFFVVAGPDTGRQFFLGASSLVGRDSRCEVRLADSRVGSLHAQVKQVHGRFVFQDLESTNGSFLLAAAGESRLRGPHALADSDELRLGHTVLKFIDMAKEKRR